MFLQSLHQSEFKQVVNIGIQLWPVFQLHAGFDCGLQVFQWKRWNSLHHHLQDFPVGLPEKCPIPLVFGPVPILLSVSLFGTSLDGDQWRYQKD